MAKSSLPQKFETNRQRDGMETLDGHAEEAIPMPERDGQW
jgi:hypothetical protein